MDLLPASGGYLIEEEGWSFPYQEDGLLSLFEDMPKKHIAEYPVKSKLRTAKHMCKIYIAPAYQLYVSSNILKVSEKGS